MRRLQLVPLLCKDAYARVRLHRDIVADMDSSDYKSRCVDVGVRLSLEI